MSLRLFSSFIIKTKNPCISCVNYMKYTHTYLHDEIYYSTSNSGNCSLFGKQHFVTGEIDYDKALECRINELKCGKKGVFYIEKK